MAQDFIHDSQLFGLGAGDTGYSDTSQAAQYQYTNLEAFINAFLTVYVGEDKLISRAKRSDVAFFAQRGLQELSYDTFRSIKALEFEVPPNLIWSFPKDYVNYVKICRVDNNGIERILYPETKTSNPFSIRQNQDGEPDFDTDGDGQDDIFRYKPRVSNTALSCTIKNIASTSSTNPKYRISAFGSGFSVSDIKVGLLLDIKKDSGALAGQRHKVMPWITSIKANGADAANPIVTLSSYIGTGFEEEVEFIQTESQTFSRFKSNTSDKIINLDHDEDHELTDNFGRRYGLEPSRAQINGNFFLDNLKGRIHFDSALSGEVVIVKYISDGIGTEYEMKVHKFAEEALYKHVAWNILNTKANVPLNVVARYKKEAFAAKRNAKLRLSNFKLEEFAQVLRNRSKQIKH